MKWGKSLCLLFIIFLFYVYCHFEKRKFPYEPMTQQDLFSNSLLSSDPTKHPCKTSGKGCVCDP
jgi:hypothetical protein